MSAIADVAVVGAGAAGLATAIFARRRNPSLSVVLLEAAKRPGAKILVSGGSRCNVTNRIITEADFWGGKRTIIRRVLRAFTGDDTVEWFRRLDVPLHEEADGKLFPDSNRSRDVLDALLREIAASGADLRLDHRVHAVERRSDVFDVATSHETIVARRVVLAAGGQSLPKSGSDGGGFRIAQSLGHSIVPTTPGLVPLVFGALGADTKVRPCNRPDAPVRASPALPSGVAHDAEVKVWIDRRVAIRLRGSLLWTHFGISGPVALNASRHWLRGQLEGRDVRLTVSFVPGESFETVDAWLVRAGSGRPKQTITAALSERIPASIAAALIAAERVDRASTLAHLSRDDRRRLAAALVESTLPVTGCRGYNYAEVTAGGVTLDEIDPATMESRVCPGLYLAGEVLDVDGRIGGFNFQWAWSSAFVAGVALATLKPSRP